MAKTKLEKELEKELGKRSLSNLCRVCEGKGLDYTGDRETLIARLVEAEKAALEPEAEPPAPEEEEPPVEEPPAEEPPEE